MVSLKQLAPLRVFYIRLARGLPVLIADISVTGCTVTTPDHIQDLEVYGHSLELVIKVGKYYCDNISCPQKYSANRCLFWLVGMVDGAILLRNASDR